LILVLCKFTTEQDLSSFMQHLHVTKSAFLKLEMKFKWTYFT